jgi:hypothetical protein
MGTTPAKPGRPSKGETVAAVRYFCLTPEYSQNGTVIGCKVSNGTINAPDWGKGAIVKVTFRVPKALFTPLAEVEIDIDTDNSGSAEVLIASLRELKEDLES